MSVSRRWTAVAVALISLLSGAVVAGAVLADEDPLRSGEVVKVDEQPDGGTDVYRSQADGEILVEHQEPDGSSWFETNEVVGYDGEPVVCPDGEVLRVDLLREVAEPTPDEARQAQSGLPDGKRAVFNEFSGEFEVVDAVTKASTYGEVSVSEPMYYACGPGNEPELVPLSEIDPEASARAHREMESLIRDHEGLTGLGGDPARENPPPASAGE